MLKNIVKHLTLYGHLLFYRCYTDIRYNNLITQQITVQFNHQCAEFEGIVSVDRERFLNVTRTRKFCVITNPFESFRIYDAKRYAVPNSNNSDAKPKAHLLI